MIETIGFILTGLGLAASIIYYANILNNANRTRELQLKAQKQAEETRQTQLYMRLWEKWDSDAFMQHIITINSWEFDTYEEFQEKYGEDGILPYSVVETFFEGIGVLVKRGLLDASIVADFMSSDLEYYWVKMKPVVDGLRNSTYPLWAEHSEYLYNEVMKIRKQQHK